MNKKKSPISEIMSKQGKNSKKKLFEKLGNKENISEYFRNLRLKRKDLQK